MALRRIDRKQTEIATDTLYGKTKHVPDSELPHYVVANFASLWDNFIAAQHGSDKGIPRFWVDGGVRELAQNVKDQLGASDKLVINLDLFQAERERFIQFVLTPNRGVVSSNNGKRNVVVLAGFTVPDAVRIRDPVVLDDCIAELASAARKDGHLMWLTEFVRYGADVIDSIARKELQNLDAILALTFAYNNLPGADVRLKRHRARIDEANALLVKSDLVNRPLDLVRGYLRNNGYEEPVSEVVADHINQKMEYMAQNTDIYRQMGSDLVDVSETYK
ncbi:MAG TPA: hypothetical protein VMV00_01660 [Candidatus Baltobacteraceae bacterium]|nr:hypothetical protein [Candidatus Baltobacteraceae bacterium]